MPADLKVVSVRLPQPLRAPCPIVIFVAIENVGNDPADPVPYDVTIDVGPGDIPDARFEAIVTTPEDQRLTPGRTIVVPVPVRLDCISPVTLRVTVDQKRQVSNNLRSAPTITLTGLIPTPVPWLVATLRVGISDRAGIVTFDPDAFCPGKVVVAEVLITNKGCITSKPSKTEVTLEDANTTPLPVRLTTYPYIVPALTAGNSHSTSFSFAAPSSTVGFSGALAVQVSADVDLANPDQCDRTQLQARIVKPFAAGGAPQLTLTVGGAGVIRPGQVPALTWEVVNECTDIGTADIRILFGTPPTELFRTRVQVPLRSSVAGGLGPGNLTIPTMLANAFWSVGLKTLEFEVIGNGSAGGPYRTTALLNVIPEPIDETWWTWVTPPTGAWKSTYFVDGSFNNLGLAGMTVSAISAVEHPTDVTSTAQDRTVAPLSGMLMPTVLPGSSTAFRWSVGQSWPWLAKGTGVEVGPRSRTFSYIANYSLTDAFGNSYSANLSSPTLVVVNVPPTKINKLNDGRGLVSIGILFLAVAVAIASAGGYAWIAAVVVAAVGMGLIIGGTILLYDAYDPPVPDFREREPVLVDPRTWTIPEVDDESLHALRTLALLVAHVVSARLRAVRYRDLMWAAYVDRSESKRIKYRGEARNELETLRRLVTAVTDTADEAHDKIDQLLNEIREWPTPEKLREMTSRFADELHLSDQERTLIAERLKTVDEQEVRRSVEQAKSYGIGTVADIVRRIYQTTASEFAEREYLR